MPLCFHPARPAHLGRFLVVVLALGCLSANAQNSPQIFRAALPGSSRAPLPPSVQVVKIVPSLDGIWYIGRDCSALPCSPTAFVWSQSGVTKFDVPTDTVRDLVLAGNNSPVLITDEGLLEPAGDGFQPGVALGGMRPRALAVNETHLWAIHDETSVSYWPVFPPSGDEPRVRAPGKIDAWAVARTGDLWLSVTVKDVAGSRLYRVARDGQINEETTPKDAENQQITSIFADFDGNIWISFSNGSLVRKSTGFSEVYGAEDGLPGTPLKALVEDRGGNYYLLFQGGAGQSPQMYGIASSSRSKEKLEFVQFQFPDLHAPIEAIAVDEQNGTWVAAGDGAFRVQGLKELQWLRGWSHPGPLAAAVAPGPRLAAPALATQTEAAAAMGTVPAGKFSILNTSRGLASDHVSSIVADRLGNLYFTTGYTYNLTQELPNIVGNGISRWDHRVLTTFNTANTGGTLASNTVHTSLYDPANDMIWFGTDRGLSRFNPNTTTFTTFLAGANIRDLRLDGAGNLWVGTLGQGVYKLRASDVTTLAQYTAANTGGRLGSDQVTSVALDGLNNLWVGTDGGNLSQFNIASGVWTNFALNISGDGARIFDVETDASNNVWIALPFQGLARRSAAGTITNFLYPQVVGTTFAANRFFNIYRDGSGNLWFGYAFIGQQIHVGASFLPASQIDSAAPAFQNYNAANNGLPVDNVLSFFWENAGTMWFGSSGGGAWRFGGPVEAPGWPQLLTAYPFYSSPVLADLNGDGKLEIVIGDTAGILYAFRSDGSLLWSYDARSAIPVGTPAGGITIQSSPAVADVDGDGNPEIVVGLNGQGVPNVPVGQGGVLILSNTGTLKRVLYTHDITDFARAGKQDGYTEAVFSTPVLANVDDDPEPEILVGAFDNFFYGWNADGSPIYARDNDGDGRFDEDGPGDWTPYTPFDATDDFPGWRGVDDDHNGDIDEGNSSDDDEDGMIDEDPPEWPFSTGDTTLSSAVVGDLLRNGNPAIIFGTDHLGGNGISRGGILHALDLRANPLPGFPKVNLEQVIWSSPVLADLDGDGYWEIIHGSGLDLSGAPNSLIGQLVYAWRKDGSSFLPGANGRFATTQGRSFASFAVGDIDNDGEPELVIATSSLRDILGNLIDASGNPTTAANAVGQLVYAFHRDGSLVPGFPSRPYTVNPAANLVGSPVLADVNGDGYLEIIIPVGPGLIVLDRNGRGVPGMGLFENLQDMTYTGESSSTPAVGDIDGDGILELVYGMGTGSSTGGILHVIKLGPVNATVQRSWPMFRRAPSRNAIFDVLIGDARAAESGGNVTFTAQVFAGRAPVSSVVANLSAFGGSSAQLLYDDGTHGDRVANDGYFSFQMAAGIPAGRYLIPITATDTAGRADSKSIFYLHAGTGKLLSISKPSIDFGTVGQGLDQEMHFSIANAGNQAVTVSALSSSNPEFYAAIPSFPQALAAGQAVIVRLRFHPNFNPAGARSATLTVQSDDGTNPNRTISLTGAARTLASRAQMGSSLSFPSTTVGLWSDLYFDVTSAGSEALIVKSIQISNPAFSIYKLSNPAFPRTFEPGVTGHYVIRFKPSQAGAAAATMTVTTNDPTTPTVSVAMTGAAIGGTAGCTYTLTPPSASVDPTAHNGATFTVTTSDSACAWTSSTSVNWLIALPDSGKGTATITYSVYPNYATTTRSGAINVGGQNYIVTQSPSTGTSDERFVKLLYFNFFGRLPSDSEVAFQVTQGVVPQGRTQVATNFFNSAEFNMGGRFIAGLYVGLLGRDAEYRGWLFQRNAMARNLVDPYGLVNNFINSAEFIAKNGTLDDAGFVRLLYRQILLREASQSEVDFQVTQGVIPYGRVQVALNILNSPEFQQLLGPRLTAFLLHACLLQRDPTATELNNRATQIQQGASLTSLIAEFVGSAEFGALIQ